MLIQAILHFEWHHVLLRPAFLIPHEDGQCYSIGYHSTHDLMTLILMYMHLIVTSSQLSQQDDLKVDSVYSDIHRW